MEFLTPEIIGSFVTLSLLEIVLGIDNLIFIALIVQNLPKEQQKKARILGLGLALAMRVVMLLGVSWLMTLTEPLFTVLSNSFSFKDILLIAGGLFLVGKVTFEMHADLAGAEERKEMTKVGSFSAVVFQIILVDLVFSFDSVITAVGMTPHIPVIVAAIVVSMVVMIAASGYISDFLRDHPTFKMLALSFILLIGVMLMAQGFGHDFPKGYIYAAFSFSLFVEILNSIASKRRRERMAREKEHATK